MWELIGRARYAGCVGGHSPGERALRAARSRRPGPTIENTVIGPVRKRGANSYRRSQSLPPAPQLRNRCWAPSFLHTIRVIIVLQALTDLGHRAGGPCSLPGPEKFRFRKHASIGAATAEEDVTFLAECYVDNGDLELLADCQDRRRIVLGRTGSGKTALLTRLTEITNAIVINPETLSFNYLTNSTVLQFFLEAGVKLNVFFKLLWRHVFTVELLKTRYNLTTSSATMSFLERFKGMLSGDRHKERRSITYYSGATSSGKTPSTASRRSRKG